MVNPDPARRPTPGSDGPIAAPADGRKGRLITEVRFFVPGQGPVLADARQRRRRDRYHLASLTPERSFKLRGRSGRGELKILTGRCPAVTVTGSITAEPEQWSKLAVSVAPMPSDWIEVAKEIWRVGPVEVTSISGDLGRWWTLALQVKASVCPQVPDEVSRHLISQGRHLWCWSYAAWLTESLGLGG